MNDDRYWTRAAGLLVGVAASGANYGPAPAFAAPPYSTTTPKAGGLLPPIALPPAQPVSPPGTPFVPPVAIALPGIGTVDGQTDPKSIRLMAKATVAVTGSGFGASPGQAFLGTDSRDRNACNLPGLRLNLTVTAWSANRLTLRMPNAVPASVAQPCDVVLIVQTNTGQLKHDATLGAAAAPYPSVPVVLPRSGVGASPKPPAPMPIGVGGATTPHGAAPGLSAPGAGITGIGPNGQGYRVTPGVDYRISGSQFGSGVGRARIVSPAIPNGTIDLIIEDWQDGGIRALIPKDVSGIPDINPLTLQVITAAGKLYTMNDVSFIATRTPPTVFSTSNNNFAAVLNLIANPIWPPAPAGTPPPAGQTASFVYRYMEGASIDCPSPGQDRVGIKLKNGWVATGVVVVPKTSTISDPNHNVYGQNGDTVFTGAYRVNHTAPSLAYIDWGVFRSHDAKGFGGPFRGPDMCVSAYDLNVTANGPVGTLPY